MVPNPSFVSYAVDAEDVVLHRALRHVRSGAYVETGAAGPDLPSATLALYEDGWSGTLVADGPAGAERVAARPRDRLAATSADLSQVPAPVHVLASQGWDAAGEALAALGHRPWVLLVVDATPDDSFALDLGYRPSLTIGSSHFFVHEHHADDLAAALSRPPSSHDGYVRAVEVRLRADLAEATASIMRWRAAALTGWPGRMGEPPSGAEAVVALLTHELAAVRATASWRITAPLRVVSGTRLARRLRGRG